MIKINLLAEAKRPAAVRRARPGVEAAPREVGVWLLGGLSLLGVLVCLVYGFLLYRQIVAKNGEIRQATAEVHRLEPIIKEVDEYKAKKAELERKIGVIEDLKRNQRGPVRVMDEVSRALPELLWLDSMEVRGNTVRIRGRAFNENAIGNFIDNLGKVPEFQEPVLEGAARPSGGGSSAIFNFSVNFKFKVLPPASASPTGATAEPTPNQSGG
jgi:type IV pilus assembly protein PilN